MAIIPNLIANQNNFNQLYNQLYNNIKANFQNLPLAIQNSIYLILVKDIAIIKGDKYARFAFVEDIPIIKANNAGQASANKTFPNLSK